MPKSPTVDAGSLAKTIHTGMETFFLFFLMKLIIT